MSEICRLNSLEDSLNHVIENGEENDENVQRARALLDGIASLRVQPPAYSRVTSFDAKDAAEAAVESPDAEMNLVKTLSIDTHQEDPPEPNIQIGVYSWGRSDLGCLFRGTLGTYDASTPVDMSVRIRQISSNTYHSAAVSTTGEVYLCGDNSSGQVSDEAGPQQVICKPRMLESLLTHRICQVSCGATHTACITATGLCLTFGSGEVGELGHAGAP